MFVYLSKKIAIPNNLKLHCVSWNREGYIAVGGDDGLLKVLKLEQATNQTGSNPTMARGGLAATSNLSMNQTLEGHKAPIEVLVWNEKQQKLTSSDRDGVIMVWMLYKGSWYEEMTNDRKKSTVKGMAWTSEGQKICIVYQDGAIVVGSVDGNRIWGKELKNTIFSGVQWSPDGRMLLFSLGNGECHLYDSLGIYMMKLPIQCVTLGPNRSINVVGLSWFHDKTSSNRPVLAVCYENGKMQIMRNHNDEAPIIIDCELQAIDAQWNSIGTIIAVCGIKPDVVPKENNQVKFYTPYGRLLRTLKIPGREMGSMGITWEGQSLRIALAVDSFIYFANIRPDYKWSYFEKTIVYLNSQTNGNSNQLTLWNIENNQISFKEIDTLLGICSCKEHCLIAVECARPIAQGKSIQSEASSKDPIYQLNLLNSLGATVDCKYIDTKPEFMAMNTSHALIASKNHFLLWHYQTSMMVASPHANKIQRDRRYHIDDNPSGVVEVLNDLDKDGYEPPINDASTQNPICSVAISEKIILIARESGVINEYSVPNVVLRTRHNLKNRSYKIGINCNSSTAAIVDNNGTMTFLDLEDENVSNKVMTNRVERKDVWAICWATDNPQLLAIMEKTRMYVLRGGDPEEPIAFSGYICNFQDLEITGVLLDDIISEGQTPNSRDHVINLRVKSLRDVEELLAHVGIPEAKQFIEDNPHPRLWRLLAEACLKKLEFDTAEYALVLCTNYPGIRLIKHLKSIPNENIQKAEVHAFYSEFDEAEKLYLDEDRRDLAIQMRKTLGDWFRVIQLYSMGPGISDQEMETAWREIGHHYAEIFQWESAKEYYQKSNCLEGLVNSLFYLEQFDELADCIAKIPEKNTLLSQVGQKLAAVGMCEEAVQAFLKYGDTNAAVNVCVNLRQWAQAIELAQRYQMPQIGQLLSSHASQLLQEGRLHEAVQLQKKAGRFLHATHLLIKLAEQEIEKKSSWLRIKKIYVLAGILTEEHINAQCAATGVSRSSVLSELSPQTLNLMEKIWHCAEAFHFILLCQRQLRFGIVHSAVVTALRLRDYEDVLDVENIYGLLGLASCADRSFGICSKAFIKLESLEMLSETVRLEYEALAVNIFSKYDPYDDKYDTVHCSTCESPIPDCFSYCSKCGTRFHPCIASGKPLIMRPLDTWSCSRCKKAASPMEMSGRKVCPLCHNQILTKKTA